jgi:hypothetical protein
VAPSGYQNQALSIIGDGPKVDLAHDRYWRAPYKGGAFQWCKPHPATASAGSNPSIHGGNEVAEAEVSDEYAQLLHRGVGGGM